MCLIVMSLMHNNQVMWISVFFCGHLFVTILILSKSLNPNVFVYFPLEILRGLLKNNSTFLKTT